VSVEGGVGQFGAGVRLARRETRQGEMATRSEHAVEQCEVADTPVGRQVVEAARVVDQVVGTGQVERKSVAAVEPDVGRAGPVRSPRYRRRREVDGVDSEARGGQMERVAAGAA